MIELDYNDVSVEMVYHNMETIKKHRERVELNCNVLIRHAKEITSDPLFCVKLMSYSEQHDKSKTTGIEFYPFMFHHWMLKLRAEGVNADLSPSMKKSLKGAVNHHILYNRHHPEFHDKRFTKTEDKCILESTDIPREGIMPSDEMKVEDLAEMVADWFAVEQSPCAIPAREFALQHIGTRWLFSDEQCRYIYIMIKLLSEK